MTISRRSPEPGPDDPGRGRTTPGDPAEPRPGDPPTKAPSPKPGPDTPQPRPKALALRATAALRRAAAPLLARARRLPRPTRTQLGVGIGIVGVLVLVGWQRCGIQGCPDVQVLYAYQPGGGPLLLDRFDQPIAHITPLQHHTVPLASLPTYVPEAFIAVEDKRFRQHHGVDWRRVPGALLANIRSHGVEQGFSTITMQLARNVFPDRLPFQQRTLRRKILEIRVAEEIEHRFSKDEILELYLNHIYFGGGAYGVDAAARYYFGKPAAKLTLAQAATLAAMPRAPSLYDPRHQPDRARERRNLVLDLMAQQHRIDPKVAAAAKKTRLGVPPQPPAERDPDGLAPYFIDEIKKALEDRYGSDLYHTKIHVHTTLDRELQAALEDELAKQLKAIEQGQYGRFRHPDYRPGHTGDAETPYLQTAAVVLDAHTGDILAMVGGRDQTQSTFDRALNGRRQMGSSFKPFVYAEAIRNGWTPIDHLDDEPFRLVMSGGQVYEPHNYDNTYSGRVTVREALIKSLNVPTVRLANSVGTSGIAAFAKSAGINEDIPQTPSMALGTVSASPMEVAMAYTPFATLGTAVRQPRWVTSIDDEDGTEIFRQAPPRTEPVMDPAVAYVVTDMLEDVVNRGTGTAVRAVGYRGVAAGKTGTTSAGRDVWFVGYTPELVGVIWMGLDEPSTILPGAAGGSLVAPVWGRMMARRARVRPDPGHWPVPEGVVRMRVDPSTGTVLTQDCWVPNAADEVFLASNVPPAGCPMIVPRGFLDRTMGWLGDVFGGEDEQQRAQDRARETQERVRKQMEHAREQAEKPKGHGLGAKLKRIFGGGDQ